ncbi:hypothetical protein PWK10_02820 [Caloramator sp. Dgby_cultured_2]|nr:hypothetical protein [Caloramator sp. Dgby_cultured_2]WDU83588.1 hypothetical protein PWK10_02820 [Caloramator sp. Dgby_cultured_2]
MKNNELVTISENTGFLQLADFNLDEAMASELDGLDMTFERIKIPSAGSTVFEVPGENPGEPDTVKEFSAVILYHHPLYAYYKDKYTGGSNPPDCGSFDGITGEGDPGGSCSKCPYNQFGSGKTAAKLARTAAGYMYCVKGRFFR